MSYPPVYYLTPEEHELSSPTSVAILPNLVLIRYVMLDCTSIITNV